LTNTLEVDPEFVDAAGNDFHLEAESPLRDAGAWLTTTTNAGSGTVLPVDATGAFCDGYGIPGVQGDVIQLEGSGETARIVRVSKADATITVDRALTWSSGQGIGSPYTGTAPDVGAFEFISPLTGIEAWRLETFGVLATDPAVSGDDADPDADGMNNLLEYALLGEPQVPDAALLPQGDTDGFGIVFRRALSRSDVLYTVHSAEELAPGSWTPIAQSVNGGPVVALVPGAEVTEANDGAESLVTVRDSRPQATGYRRFLRLLISR
jgi:hypothetical protein